MSSIKRFIIKGLFGYKNVELNFEDIVQIYIGENGLGKTTILNVLYYVLSCEFKKLSKICFSSIEIHFLKDKVTICKDEIQRFFVENEDRRRMSSIIRAMLSEDEVEMISGILKSDSDETEKKAQLRSLPAVRSAMIRTHYPPSRVLELMNRVINSPLSDFEAKRAIIKKNIKSKILYFPTYRRIEEELKNLDIVENLESQMRSRHEYIPDIFVADSNSDDDTSPSDTSLIQFGMLDVEKRIKIITQEISKSSVSGFSKLTGDMLVQLLRGYPDVSAIEKINIEDIEIILNRVGDNLARNDKNKVMELIRNNKIFGIENKQLIYFLQKLLELYKSQHLYDSAIKDFVKVCNGYFNDKHYVYDESTVDLRIFRNQNKEIKEEVSLSQLSSGEKQIVSLFAKIYLEPSENFIVLFDEPELSLSVFWQKKLLPDIINSNRCDFLLAVTHSPFIFENDLVKNTIGLKEFMEINQCQK